MNEQNGDNIILDTKSTDIQENTNETIIEKKIEDILDNDKYINDLRINPKSRFRKLLSTENIKKLINYCLNPKAYLEYEQKPIVKNNTEEGNSNKEKKNRKGDRLF